MSDAILSQARFHDDDAARQYLEDIRWPQGAICPHCGGTERNSAITSSNEAESKVRAGLYFCGDCRSQFTVTVGTVFERSKISLSKWVMATHLMCASKKGISAKQLERMLGVTYKTAWFMAHRIREAMKSEGGMLGGGGKIVEADETYVGGKEKNKHASKRTGATGGAGKQMVFSLVERGGKVRSMHLPSVNAKNLAPVLKAQMDVAKTHLMTDGEGQYKILAPLFASHESVNHGGGEYVRGNAYTNTVEGFFSIFKRGIIGTFHHVSPQHLQRYATEFDFRYNNRSKLGIEDVERTAIALKGISGKRLTYRSPNATA